MEDAQMNLPESNDPQLVSRRRLGRGLNALLGGGESPAAEEALAMAGGAATGTPAVAAGNTEYVPIPVDSIARNPYQPRTEFDSEELAELVQSIAQHGVLQPLLVRKVADGWQLIAGERRLLASRRVGLAEVPCRVVEMDDKSVCEVAIVENVQRADLNDLEKATAFQGYLDKFGGSIEELARKMGKDRSTISHCLRLLELPEPVKQALGRGAISAGHARALLPLEVETHQVDLCAQIVAESLSVRRTEELVREKLLSGDVIPFAATAAGGAKPKGRTRGGSIGGAHVRDLERQLREALGTKVEISLKAKQAGKLVVHFANNEDFERICHFLKKAS
jgi:ParB family chromosome partitioning protein